MRIHSTLPIVTVAAVLLLTALSLAAEARRKGAFSGLLPKFSTSYDFTLLNKDPSSFFPGIKSEIPAMTMTSEQVTTAYVRVLKAERLREVARQSVALLEAHRRTAQGLCDVHMLPRNDALGDGHIASARVGRAMGTINAQEG